MSDARSTQFKDSLASRTTARSARRAAPGLLQRLVQRLSLKRPSPYRTPSQLSTLPPPSRGQALREAHRTLAARLSAHPHIRQVLPHLAAIERSLAKRGSRALLRLQVPVLQRGLEQLALLQHEDESPNDAANLRVLRLRLMEAITSRSARPGTAKGSRLTARDLDEPGFDDLDAPRGLPLPTAEARDLSASAFAAAQNDWEDPILDSGHPSQRSVGKRR